MLAGLFARAGYFQGDDLYPPREANPKGFFENWQINSLNERVMLASVEASLGHGAAARAKSLHREGQYWLMGLPAGVSCSAWPEDRVEIETLVARRPFCFKDPRFSYTLEAWMDAAPDAVALCVYRPPGVVIASILSEMQNAAYLHDLRIGVADLYANWRAIYVRLIRMRSAGRAIRFVRYESLFEAGFFSEIETFVGARLDRRFPDRKLDRRAFDGELDPETRAVADALDRLTARGLKGQTERKCLTLLERLPAESVTAAWLDLAAESDVAKESAELALSAQSTELEAARSQLLELQGHCDRLRIELTACAGRVHEQSEELGRRQLVEAAREADVAALRQALTRLETERDTALARTDVAQRSLEDLGTRFDALATRLAEREQEIAAGAAQAQALRDELSAASDRQAWLQAALDEARTGAEAAAQRIAGLESRAEADERRIVSLESGIEAGRSREAAQASALAEHAARIRAREDELAMSRGAAGRLDEELSQQGRVLAALRAEHEQQAARLRVEEAARAEQSRRAAALEADLSRAEAKSAVFEDELAATRASLAGVRDILDRITGERDGLRAALEETRGLLDMARAELGQTRDQLAVESGDLATARSRIRYFQVEIGERDASITRLQGIHGELEKALDEAGIRQAGCEARIAALEQDLAARVDELRRMLASRSWRFTAPIRSLRRWIGRIFH